MGGKVQGHSVASRSYGARSRAPDECAQGYRSGGLKLPYAEAVRRVERRNAPAMNCMAATGDVQSLP